MPAWLQILVALVLIVTFLGSAAVFLHGSVDKGTINTYKASNSALSERNSVLVEENTNLKARVTTLERDNARLQAERPSAEAIAGIDAVLTAFIARTDKILARIMTALVAVATTLRGSDDSSE